MRNRLLAGAAVAALLIGAVHPSAHAQNDADGPALSAQDIAEAIVDTDAERFGAIAFATVADDQAPLDLRAAAFDMALALSPEAGAMVFAALVDGIDPTSAPPAADRAQCRADRLAAAIAGFGPMPPCPPAPLAIETLDPTLLVKALAAAHPADGQRRATEAEIRAVVAAALDRAARDGAAADAETYGRFIARAGAAAADEALSWIAGRAAASPLPEAQIGAIVDAIAAGGTDVAADYLVAWFVAERGENAPAGARALRDVAARALPRLDLADPNAEARAAWIAALLATPQPASDKNPTADVDQPLTAEILAAFLRPFGPDGAAEWRAVFEPALAGASQARRVAIFDAWALAMARGAPEAPRAAAADAALAFALADAAPLLSSERAERGALAAMAPHASETVATALVDRAVVDAALADRLDRDGRALWRAVVDRALASPDGALAEALGAQLYALSEAPAATLAQGLGVAPDSAVVSASLAELGARLEAGAPAAPAAALALRLIEPLDPTDLEARAAVAASNLDGAILDDVAEAPGAAKAFAAALRPFLTWRAAVDVAPLCAAAGAAIVDGAAGCRIALETSATMVMRSPDGAPFFFALLDSDGRVLDAGACLDGEGCATAVKAPADRELTLVLETPGAAAAVEYFPAEPLAQTARPPRPALGDAPIVLPAVDYPVDAVLDGEVWIELPPNLDGVYILETVDLVDENPVAGFVDPLIALYENGGAEASAFDDDGGVGFGARLGLSAEPGVRYQASITNIGAPGAFTLRLRRAEPGESLPPLRFGGGAGVARLDAEPLELGVVYTIEAEAAAEGWFRLPPIEGRGLRIDTFDLVNVDTVAEVFAPGEDFAQVYDDDGGDGFGSRAMLIGEPGAEYDLKLSNIGAPGQFNLRVSPALMGAEGPTLTAAPALPPQEAFLGDRYVMAVESGEAAVWLAFEAPSDAPFVIETTDLIDVDTIVEVWSDGGLELIASDDDGGVGFASRLSFAPEAGETYWIRVWNLNLAEGVFVLTIDGASAE